MSQKKMSAEEMIEILKKEIKKEKEKIEIARKKAEKKSKDLELLELRKKVELYESQLNINKED